MPFDIEDARARVADLERAEPAELQRDIRALARPRLSGTEAAAEVDAELRSRFEELGYETRELPFSFSTLPGQYGLTAAGALLAVGGGVGAGMISAGLPVLALIVLVAAAVLALLPLLVLGRAIRGLPAGRLDATNLLFSRPGSRPSWIVMAHRDSKSQLVPTLLRTAAVAVAAISWLALVVLAGLWFGGDIMRFPAATMVVGGILVIAALVLAFSWAANASPGALDNATGLAALLAVARRTGETGDVAFLLTDGEELGLAGARAAARELPPVQGVINVDGLDDAGRFYVAEGHGWGRQGSAPQLAAALLTAGNALDLPIERRPLPRSILVDHLPIAAAGIPALTLLRGRWSSLLRVHRPGDSPDRLNGRGAADGATLLTAALRLLADDAASHLAGRRAAGS